MGGAGGERARQDMTSEVYCDVCDLWMRGGAYPEHCHRGKMHRRRKLKVPGSGGVILRCRSGARDITVKRGDVERLLDQCLTNSQWSIVEDELTEHFAATPIGDGDITQYVATAIRNSLSKTVCLH